MAAQPAAPRFSTLPESTRLQVSPLASPEDLAADDFAALNTISTIDSSVPGLPMTVSGRNSPCDARHTRAPEPGRLPLRLLKRYGAIPATSYDVTWRRG